ncbi:Sialidase precursor [Limihaloglobus sulfuriphilus]|uniref:exo-alpha-sialidase n=1 Tax=Limihaloglobus sulfuriphilus TaxID=1851148 RepID=A0A1Q2MCQ6_9BACT|nr:sialidase family protein [Limihaloglobus sulfuriphilus]AQQ70481.1 Sialidase precursor [Limihaloglobus sulfuriphilus]
MNTINKSGFNLLKLVFFLCVCISVVYADSSSFNRKPLFASGQDGYDTYRIPSIIATSKGTVLAVCEGRKEGVSDTGDIDLILKRSEDSAKTWSETKLIWSDGNNTCGNPCLVENKKTGTIFLFSTWNLGSDHEREILKGQSKDTRRVYYLKSSDEGKTWSKPVEITKDSKKEYWKWYATGPGVGIQLEYGLYKGRLVIPANHSYIGPEGNVFGSHVIYSDDNGQSWNLSDSILPGLNESQVVELIDGKLLMNMRNYRYRGSRGLAFSTNGGQSWPYTAFKSNLIEPRCQAAILRYSPNEQNTKSCILFCNPESITQRVKMTVKMSFDEAKTWPVSKTVYEGPSAYSCMAVLPDNRICCFFESGKKNPYERIELAVFTLDWLKDGNESKR